MATFLKALITIYSADITRAVDFYGRVLGLEETYRFLQHAVHRSSPNNSGLLPGRVLVESDSDLATDDGLSRQIKLAHSTLQPRE